MPKAVIFDVDGTLVDTVAMHAQAWSDTFRRFGHDIPAEDILGQIGKGGDQLMPVFLDEATVGAQGEAMETFRAEHYKERYLPEAKGFPAVRELFERIRADGVVIALASSGKPEELEVYADRLGIIGLFDAQTTSDDAERSKPEPDIFEAALDRLGAPAPEDVVVVGDSPYDAQAARKAGIEVVGLLSGGFPEEELRAVGCSAVFRDPEDLLRRFEDSPLARS
jgi:HAD superfamily hydrolase (TIGR01509 family)